MLSQLGNTLYEGESIGLTVTQKKEGNFSVIVSFKPKVIPTSTKVSQFDKRVQEDIKGKQGVLEKVRAELAKPRVLTGTPEEIDEQLLQLATLSENPAYKKLNSVFEVGLEAVESLIAEAEAVIAKSKATKKATSAKKEVSRKKEKLSTTKDTGNTETKKTQPELDSNQFSLLDVMGE